MGAGGAEVASKIMKEKGFGLPDIIEHFSDSTAVVMVPKTGERVGHSQFFNDVTSLIDRFKLRGVTGTATLDDYEAPKRGGNYRTHRVEFSDESSANRFYFIVGNISDFPYCIIHDPYVETRFRRINPVRQLENLK